MLFISVTAVILVVVAGQDPRGDVDGGWTPWERDPSVDCCAYGAVARYRRYCANPAPEGKGKQCTTINGTYASTEDVWRTCECGCWPPCDGITSFCANDTGTGAYCKCNYPLVIPVGTDYMNVTSCVPPTTIDLTTTTVEPVTMATDTKKTMDLAMYISIVIMLGCLAVSFVLMIFMFGFKPLRVIQMNEELTLAGTYVLIGFLVQHTDDRTICAAVAMLLHYLFLCSITFFCLEALFTYSLVTYVVPVRGFLPTLVNILVGYGVPLIPLAFSVGFLYDTYGNNGRHCWCDLEDSTSGPAWAFLFPISFGALACTVIAEAQGQGKYEPLPGSDQAEYRGAKVSQHTVMVNMALAVASYVMGLLAVDMQLMPLYIVFFVLTIGLGLSIMLTHAACCPTLSSVCPCGGRTGPRSAMNARVTPTPPPDTVKIS